MTKRLFKFARTVATPRPRLLSCLMTPPPDADYVKDTLKKVLIANRADCADRMVRTAVRFNIPVVVLVTPEDAGLSYANLANLPEGSEVIRVKASDFMDPGFMIRTAQEHDCPTIVPGWGFLSENHEFVRMCEKSEIRFVGPSSDAMQQLGDKDATKRVAKAAGVPTSPGINPVEKRAAAIAAGTYREGADFNITIEDLTGFIGEYGYPVVLKAVAGGGGRGQIKIVEGDSLQTKLAEAKAEAQRTCGNPTVLLERWMENIRHIEVQIVSDPDGTPHAISTRDCSAQRRNQKVVEEGPAVTIPAQTQELICSYAEKIAREAGYRNAGTVEFMVDQENRPYLLEVNTRLQVEHPVTEEVAGLDLVEQMFRVASGLAVNLSPIGEPAAHCIELRVIAEHPTMGPDGKAQFSPQTGVIQGLQWPLGVRVETGLTLGSQIGIDFDPMIAKLVVTGTSRENAIENAIRALEQTRIIGLQTNIGYLMQILKDSRFQDGQMTTNYLERTPALYQTDAETQARISHEKQITGVIQYATQLNQGIFKIAGALRNEFGRAVPTAPDTSLWPRSEGSKDRLARLGKSGFLDSILDGGTVLMTDTTMRDAQQSLIATRLRSADMNPILDGMGKAGAPLFSAEVWGGATFDVALQFLMENPFQRLREMREKMPGQLLQMLFRATNALGYGAYPKATIVRFAEHAIRSGIDVIRIFDASNDLDNLRFAIAAIKEAAANLDARSETPAGAGMIEGGISYVNDKAPQYRWTESKYTVDYYLGVVDELVKAEIDILAIKDMAGLATPESISELVSEIRRRYPRLVIHLHTHASAGNNEAVLIAAAKAGANIVDVATDSMSGDTSQASMQAFIRQGRMEGINIAAPDEAMSAEIDRYYEAVRANYAPMFQPDNLRTLTTRYPVGGHQVPGGQFTNLGGQAVGCGIKGGVESLIQKYVEAEWILSPEARMIKVTPSSKAVGDLAIYIVTMEQNLGRDVLPQEIIERVEAGDKTIELPPSVVELLTGKMGEPPFGMREPFRSLYLETHGLLRTTATEYAESTSVDFEALRAEWTGKFGRPIHEDELVTAALFPKVFETQLGFRNAFGDPSRVCFSSENQIGIAHRVRRALIDYQ
ncbi:ATP-grasp domain-containing protein [bacterium]|nr:ATP-grasp domain-containing protein [bacterium]